MREALRRHPHWPLVALVILGLVVRFTLAFGTVGHPFDIESFAIVGRRMGASPLELYETARWPYPPLYAPYAAVAHGLSTLTGLPFHGWIHLPAIAADMVLALLIVWAFARVGAPRSKQLTAAALVVGGPSFLLTTGYHGQFDSLAILPALAACLVWAHRWRGRSTLAGLLIGAAIALKTFPGLFLFALLPTARSFREALRLVLFAGLLPAVLLIPYVVATPSALLSSLRYSGFPGLGGLSIVVQPHLAETWLLKDAQWNPTWLTELMWGWTPLLIAATTVGALALLRSWRAEPIDAALLLVLAFYTVSWSFFPQYALWALPFLLLAGRFRESLVMQVAVTAPALLYYLGPWEPGWMADIYKIAMGLLWAGFAVACLLWAREIRRKSSTIYPTRSSHTLEGGKPLARG